VNATLHDTLSRSGIDRGRQRDRTTDAGSDLNVSRNANWTGNYQLRKSGPDKTGPVNPSAIAKGLKRCYTLSTTTVSFRHWMKDIGISRKDRNRIVATVERSRNPKHWH
jgi:hypothetical protein